MEAHLTESQEDPRLTILHSPMSLYQVTAVGVTAALCALDGFDILAAGIAAPGIVKEWGVSNAVLGIFFSTGFVGMAAGSLVISPLADRVGRRKVIFLGLGLVTLGMLLTASACNVTTLVAWRLLTGLGIGAMISVIYPLAAEYANARRRDLSISVTAAGYTIGGVIGGAAAAALLTHYSWRSVFALGAAAGLLMVPTVYLALPESVPYLVDSTNRGALAQVNAFLSRCGMRQVSEIVAAPIGRQRLGVREIFRRDVAASTLQMTAINLLTFTSAYYFISWIPHLIASLGFTAPQAARVLVAASLGGVVGSVALGYVSGKVGLKPVVLVALFGMAVMFAIFSLLPAELTVMTLTAAVCGMFVFASTTGMYAILARTFSAHTRATGVGFVIGVGRVSSAFGPGIAGYLFSLGYGQTGVAVIMAVPALLAFAILVTFRVRHAPTYLQASHGGKRVPDCQTDTPKNSRV